MSPSEYKVPANVAYLYEQGKDIAEVRACAALARRGPLPLVVRCICWQQCGKLAAIVVVAESAAAVSALYEWLQSTCAARCCSVPIDLCGALHMVSAAQHVNCIAARVV